MNRLFLILFLCILSCGSNDDVDCTLALPPAPVFIITFEDPQGNPLIGNTFVQDSFKLSNPSSTVYLKPYPSGPQDELVVWLPDINSGDTYFLELSEEDTDTLIIEHSQRTTPCFTLDELDKFIYNQDVLFDQDETGGDRFVIVKE